MCMVTHVRTDAEAAGHTHAYRTHRASMLLYVHIYCDLGVSTLPTSPGRAQGPYPAGRRPQTHSRHRQGYHAAPSDTRASRSDRPAATPPGYAASSPHTPLHLRRRPTPGPHRRRLKPRHRCDPSSSRPRRRSAPSSAAIRSSRRCHREAPPHHHIHPHCISSRT